MAINRSSNIITAPISNNKVVSPRIDSSTHSLQSIEYEHHEVHAGSAYGCHFTNDCTNTGEMTVIAFNTPNTTKWIHLVANATASAQASFGIYENTSIDVDEGTQLTLYNRNRNSANTSALTSIEAAPVANKATSFNEAQAAAANITTTTEVYDEHIGSGSGVRASGGSTRGQAEWVLKQNQQYAIIITNLNNDDNTHNISLSWYEHTNKD